MLQPLPQYLRENQTVRTAKDWTKLYADYLLYIAKSEWIYYQVEEGTCAVVRSNDAINDDWVGDVYPVCQQSEMLKEMIKKQNRKL